MAKCRGIVLFSGGLDSLLTSRILMDQGIEVIGLHCILPFVEQDRDPAELGVSRLAEEVGIRLVYYRCGKEYLDMVKNPPHGYGKRMNPCIDCKIHFIKKAGEFMRSEGAQFVATGEVVGQRPMSQLKHMLGHIEKVTDLGGRLLRPMSAKLLAPTVPEIEGLVDRERLYDINGRSRRRQMELVKRFGIDRYSSPAGGCLFTDPNIAPRVKDLIDHVPGADQTDYFLLTVGRHFRISPEAKMIVAKNEKENIILEKYLPRADHFFIPLFRGPSIYVAGHLRDEDMSFISRVMARYGRPGESDREIEVYARGVLTGTMRAGSSMEQEVLERMRIF